MPKKCILVDANAIIFFHQNSQWGSVLNAYNTAVTPIIRRECRFYRDPQGEKKPIDLHKTIQENRLKEIPVSIQTFDHLPNVLKEPFLRGIDDGEREVIAWLYENRQNTPYRFCTADALAAKCLGVLGLRQHGISVQELLENAHIKSSVGHPLSKQYFDKMLNEGFSEAAMHKTQKVH
jgi:hypothetical protein